MAAAPPTAPASTVTSDATTSRWPSLPDDLVRLVASRLLAAGDLLDYVRFRAVCASWRSGAASPRGRGVVDPRFHPRRWMPLPEGNGLYPGHPKLNGYVRFFNLDTGAFVRAHIPLLSEDHCVLDTLDGLLVLQRDHDTAIRLLHPFTGDILDLPPLSTLLPQMRLVLRGLPARKKLPRLRNFSTSATFVDAAVTVMLALSNIDHVAVATAQQDQRWTMSTWHCPAMITHLPFSCQGKAYVVDDWGDNRPTTVFQIDTPLPGEALQPPKLIATCNAVQLYAPVYLVECDSEVLVISQNDIRFFEMQVLVYKLSDLVMERDIPVTSIGDKAIFLQRRPLCVSAKAFPGLEADTIVRFHPVEHYLGQYHLGSGSWSPAMDECSLYGTESGPCSLVQHIYTCCDCRHWNKGLLNHRGKYRGGWLRWPVKPKLRTGA